MADVKREFACITLLSISVYIYLLYRPGVSDIIRWSIVTVMLLGIFSLFLHLLKQYYSRHKLSSSKDIILTEAQQQKKAKVQAEKQKEHLDKAQNYLENIIKPKEEKKLQQKEESFRRFSGPAWKGQGHALQENDEDEGSTAIRRKGTSKDAAVARKLPEHVTRQPQKKTEVKAEPKKIELPLEPAEGADGSVALSFRTPRGQICRRRFLQTDRVQVLLDYITTLGYPQRFYTICTSYPRTSLSEHYDSTLIELGISRGCVLNVEEKDR